MPVKGFSGYYNRKAVSAYIDIRVFHLPCIEEKDLSDDRLVKEVSKLLSDKDKLVMPCQRIKQRLHSFVFVCINC